MKITSIEHLWIVEVARTIEDWPDHQITATLWLHPTSVQVTLRRLRPTDPPVPHLSSARWRCDTLEIRGERYRPLKDGTHQGRGPGMIRHTSGRAWPEYHTLIRALEDDADRMYLR